MKNPLSTLTIVAISPSLPGAHVVAVTLLNGSSLGSRTVEPKDFADAELLFARAAVTEAADALSNIGDAVKIKLHPSYGAVIEYPSSLRAVARETVPSFADPVYRPTHGAHPSKSFDRAPGSPVSDGVSSKKMRLFRGYDPRYLSKRWFLDHQYAQQLLHTKLRALLGDYRLRVQQVQNFSREVRGGLYPHAQQQVHSAIGVIAKLTKEKEAIEREIHQLMPQIDLKLVNSWGRTHVAVNVGNVAQHSASPSVRV